MTDTAWTVTLLILAVLVVVYAVWDEWTNR